MKQKELVTSILLDVGKMVPGQSVDCVIMGFFENELKILIIKWKDRDVWTLPGGFIKKEEDMDQAAIRVLKERTGIDLPFLEQFKTFGQVNRRDGDGLMIKLQSLGVPDLLVKWLGQRFITTGYLSLVNTLHCNLQPDFTSDEIRWVSPKELPQLIFDHNHIVQTAVEYVKSKMNYLPIGITLLPEKFTMKELQMLYESILNRKLDRGNFQRKMLKLGIFIRLEKKLIGKAHKAPYFYSFDKDKYNSLLKEGFGFNY